MNEIKIYKEMEDKFRVIYPKSKSTTYISKLNYYNENTKYRQRWYNYKEGYSTNLVKELIDEYNTNPKGIILDPFLGSGTTIMAANERQLSGIGFEVNPFSFFLSKSKLKNYDSSTAQEFLRTAKIILDDAEKRYKDEKIIYPKLSFAKQVFHEDIDDYFMTIRNLIFEYNENPDVKNLLILSWLSALEPVSLYRKAGNGLKKRTSEKTIINEICKVHNIIEDIQNSIFEDIINSSIDFDSKIINDSSLNLDKYLDAESVSGVIFSPPYANSFDYTEIYKLELWFGNFIDDYSDLKKLRRDSVRSHLNGIKAEDVSNSPSQSGLVELDFLLKVLETKDLWSRKIPYMIKQYFIEMFELLEKLYNVIEKDGFCSIVVGNSSYGGVIFPTDLLLAKYAEKVGFTVDKIIIDRFIITSSQQYSETHNKKEYLRESIVCLKKI